MFAFLHRKKKSFWNEFTVLGAFAATVVAGLMYAAMALTFGYAQTDATAEGAAMQAPTTDGYRQEAREVMSPFLSQALSIDKNEIGAADPIFLELATKTQERMLRLRVPKEEQDTHLTFVLLLDQWKRALGGSAPDRAVVVEKTTQVVETHTWVQ